VVLFYVASLAIQQLRLIARLRWAWIIAITLAPGLIIAFRTAWVLEHVMTWLAYNGVMYVGLAAVFLGDFFFIRQRHLEVAHLFARPRQGAYWYWRGVNWIAIAVIAASAAIYLVLFNPVSYRVGPMFRYFGAGIPAVVIGCASYVAAMKLYYIWRGRTTGRESREATSAVVDVSL
jgi:cytosine/uracil/thiamine/allantoin permease